MAIREFNKEDLDALLIGLGIFGTGGGGDPEWGRKIIEKDFAMGRKYRIVDPEDVAGHSFVCSGGIMGSVKALEGMSYSQIIEGWEEDFVLIRAFKEMETIAGRKLDYVIPFEAGGLNTPVIMTLAARLGIPIINGDALGRSAPETQMTSFIGHGISLYPMPLVDGYGNTVVVKTAKEPFYADEMGRIVVTRGGGYGANSHYPMTGEQLKASCVPGTITNSIDAGRSVIEARRAGKDPVEAFRKLVYGMELFRGEIKEVSGEDKGGFYLTKVKIEGIYQYIGSSVDIVVKNEYMAVWLDGRVRAVFPDLVCMLYSDNGEGVMSVDVKPGMDVTLIGIPCHERLRETMATEEGKKALGGARYGYPDLSYVPMEQLNR